MFARFQRSAPAASCAVLRLGAACLLLTTPLAAETAQAAFYEDVLPILQRRCQNCHRLGEIGPMPLLTYEQARPWAKALRESVLLRRMPPWHGDRGIGVFLNDRSHDRLLGRRRRPGRRSLQGPAAARARGRLGDREPDIVFEMPLKFEAPASGTVPYQYIKIPSGFTEDRWIQAVEIRPGNRALVHHAVVYAREPGAEWASRGPLNELFELWKIQPPAGPSPGKRMFSSTKEPEHFRRRSGPPHPCRLRDRSATTRMGCSTRTRDSRTYSASLGGICKAVYDNSANNLDNPDPAAWVNGGFQSEDEMMAGFVEVGASPDLGTVDVFRDAPPQPEAEAADRD